MLSGCKSYAIWAVFCHMTCGVEAQVGCPTCTTQPKQDQPAGELKGNQPEAEKVCFAYVPVCALFVMQPT
jgi:hypothetical protein